MLETLDYSIKDVPITMYCLTDKHYRLQNRIISRIRGLKKQAKIHRCYNQLDFYMYYEAPYHMDLGCLEDMLQRIVANKGIYNKALYIDNMDNIYKEVYSEFTKYPKSIEEHSRMLFGGNFYRNRYMGKRNPVIDRFLENFKAISLKARQRDMEALLRLEAYQRYAEGWYFVFNTLTVGNEYLKEVFDAGSSAWTNYIRSVDRSIGIKCYGSWSEAIEQRRLGNEFHAYFAVVERGTDNGRLHIHVLHICKVLPSGCGDPNAGTIEPYRREISHFKGYWKYGVSCPIAVRFNNSDAYGRCYWRWPVERKGKGYVAIQCREVDAIISYLGKYISKELDKKPPKEEMIKWRVRKSRNLGKKYLQLVVNNLNEDQLKLVMVSDSWMLRMRDRPLPIQRLKLMCLRNLLQIWMTKNSQSLLTSIQELEPRESLLVQLVNIMNGKTNCKKGSAGLLRVTNMSAMEGFNLKKVFEDIAIIMFGIKGVKYECGTYTGGIL